MDWTQDAALPPIPLYSWTDQSRATVAFLPGEHKAAERVSQRLFGRSLQPREYAGLAGAPDDAKVDVGASDGQLYIELGDPVATAFRGHYYLFCSKTAVVLRNDGFHIFLRAMRRHGFGLQVHCRQTRNAAACGVNRIDLWAGRRRDENGYYTWPRYGFDCPLPASIRRRLPIGLEQSRTLLDLMSCEKGRDWWREHGVTVRVQFDLAPGSRSQRVLAEYVRTRLGGDSQEDSAARTFPGSHCRRATGCQAFVFQDSMNAF
jgi:hypothetical protein